MDIQYWSTFYKHFPISNRSDFCHFILDYFKDDNTIQYVLDAGCGNGRDSNALSTKYNVIGIDNCDIQLKPDTYTFKKEDFITYDKSTFDLIYSRFTFHSITNEDHDRFLSSIHKNTWLAIETRSTVESHNMEYHGKTHYRNYTDIEYLKTKLEKYDFKIHYIKEDKGFAIYNSEDPICIRVVAKKI
jgi:trans-aconitate methyltransferase